MASPVAGLRSDLGHLDGKSATIDPAAPFDRVTQQPRVRPEDLDPREVAARLVALARAAAPLRREIARVAGRLVAGRGFERLGFARARDYARERAGVSGRQLEELAHMDRAFGQLPELARAFARGEVSWTQARLLARVATPEDTQVWLSRAAGLTARELSREVRAVDGRAHDVLRPETDEEGEEESSGRETVFVHCTPVVRAKWHRARFLASRMEGRAIPAWMVAERIAAEALSAIPLDEAAVRRIEAEVGVGGDSTPEAAAASACAAGAPPEPIPDRLRAGVVAACHPVFCGDPVGPVASANRCAAQGDPVEAPIACLEDGLDEADPFELDLRLRRALDGERRLEAQLGPPLLTVETGRLYRGYGCASLGEFARECLGMSPRKAEALVRLERAGRVAPVLARAYRAGRLSWAQAQLLVPLVQKPGSESWHAAWVEHADRVTVRRLEDEVSRALAIGRHEPPPLDPPGGSWEDGRADEPADPSPADPQTGARPTPFSKAMSFFFTAPRDVARLFRGALATVQRRIERKNGRTASESEALDGILEHAFETWQLANAELQREHRVFERDGWRCTFPGCTSYGNLQDHHLEYRSHGGSNRLSNRTTLCVWHHQRGEHAKILRCRGKAPARLHFELGVRLGRPPLARYRSGDVRLFGG